MHKNVKKKMHFTLEFMIHLTKQSRGTPEGTFDDAPRDALSDFHKDAQEGVGEVALKSVLEVLLELHLCLLLFMQ